MCRVEVEEMDDTEDERRLLENGFDGSPPEVIVAKGPLRDMVRAGRCGRKRGQLVGDEEISWKRKSVQTVVVPERDTFTSNSAPWSWAKSDRRAW